MAASIKVESHGGSPGAGWKYTDIHDLKAVHGGNRGNCRQPYSSLCAFETTLFYSPAPMIRQIFIWRARRQLARSRYRIDRRRYPKKFRAGFVSHLQSAHFWESKRDPGLRRKRWRARAFKLLLLALAAFLAWVAWESIHAISIFDPPPP